MWCKACNSVIETNECSICGNIAESDVPVKIMWCHECLTPVIKTADMVDLYICPICNKELKYLSSDLRPVFPEERLLIEIMLNKPLEFIGKSVWASTNRYFIDGELETIPIKYFKTLDVRKISQSLKKYESKNNYVAFNKHITTFIKANKNRFNYITDEATNFIIDTASSYPRENIVVSFSGGKDSTVTADLTTRALSDPSLVHIFGNTTLEFPLTLEYAKRFREDNPKAIFKVAQNKEQDFYSVCKDIGPPARMLRWCCSMFKTGPITRVINNMYKDENILTFYGIRKCESVSRSKYNRVENDPEAVKIQKQKVASPIFLWKDIDIWLYIFSAYIDFNDAYRQGYDRVGCWCCPNNNERAQFLSRIYMPEQSKDWRDFLITFAKQVGKPDPEVYVDDGKWKARQGGNGVLAAEDVKIKFTNCTAEDNALVYRLVKAVDDSFYDMFIPFGRIAHGLGKKLINEVVIVDMNNIPIISIQPFNQNDYEYSVKIKTMNVAKHDDLQRKIGYQIKKYNACRKCLKCESLCKFGAIKIIGDEYIIHEDKCKRCKMCVTNKYLDGGCMMEKYLRTKI